MKSLSRIHRCFAFALLLIFTVQAGLGLCFHTFFHQTTTTEQTNREIKDTEQRYLVSVSAISCSCVDDFLVPFTATTGIAIPIAAESFFVQPNATYYWYTPDSLQLFRSLRAPPASVS